MALCAPFFSPPCPDSSLVATAPEVAILLFQTRSFYRTVLLFATGPSVPNRSYHMLHCGENILHQTAQFCSSRQFNKCLSNWARFDIGACSREAHSGVSG